MLEVLESMTFGTTTFVVALISGTISGVIFYLVSNRWRWIVNCRHNRARVFRRNGASSKCSKNSLGRFFQNGRFTSFFAFVFSVFRSLYFCCCGPDGVAR